MFPNINVKSSTRCGLRSSKRKPGRSKSPNAARRVTVTHSGARSRSPNLNPLTSHPPSTLLPGCSRSPNSPLSKRRGTSPNMRGGTALKRLQGRSPTHPRRRSPPAVARSPVVKSRNPKPSTRPSAHLPKSPATSARNFSPLINTTLTPPIINVEPPSICLETKEARPRSPQVSQHKQTYSRSPQVLTRQVIHKGKTTFPSKTEFLDLLEQFMGNSAARAVLTMFIQALRTKLQQNSSSLSSSSQPAPTWQAHIYGIVMDTLHNSACKEIATDPLGQTIIACLPNLLSHIQQLHVEQDVSAMFRDFSQELKELVWAQSHAELATWTKHAYLSSCGYVYDVLFMIHTEATNSNTSGNTNSNTNGNSKGYTNGNANGDTKGKSNGESANRGGDDATEGLEDYEMVDLETSTDDFVLV